MKTLRDKKPANADEPKHSAALLWLTLRSKLFGRVGLLLLITRHRK